MKHLWTPKNTQDRAAIHKELEAIIASEQFRSSGRYPVFLQHVVEKTLNGDIADLKERTLGISVFHRDSAYNTADDPVVRVCGSEVRRRIAQFYQQSEGRRKIEIELPPGGYTPRFWRWDSADGASDETEHETGTNHLVPRASTPEVKTNENDTSGNKEKDSGRRWFVAFVAGVLGTLLVVGWIKLASNQRQEHTQDDNSMMQVWGSLLTNPNSVLISVGRPHPPGEVDPPPLSGISIKNRFYEPSYRVSITAVSAVSEVAGFLQTHNKTFRIHVSDSNSLNDLHQTPVVLVNGNDNKWTVLFLKSLRFGFDSYADGGQRFSYIKDEQHPEQKEWRVNFNQPYLQQTLDYAIVGRFYCPTTESPVVVIAGISSNGTEAAGEFMTSPDRLAALARAAHSSLDKNFEAVLKVQVVGGSTGAVTPVASQFW